MARSQNQKAKILYLERMIRETGENHVITLQEILTELAKYDICAERKSIYDDFEVLRSFGLDVRFRRGRNGGYYLAGQMVDDKMPVVAEAESADACAVETQCAEVQETEQDPAEEKRVKLQFTKEKEQEVRAYFGKMEKGKEKEENLLTGWVSYTSEPKFFGQLTAMGKDVKIMKPKKLGQSYREYLKMIAKAYK